jgi:excisionase family DNA binding protein
MPIEMKNEMYYSVKEACSYLEITRDTLYRRINSGQLQKYTHGAKNRVYFRLADLIALKELHPIEPRKSEQNPSAS